MSEEKEKGTKALGTTAAEAEWGKYTDPKLAKEAMAAVAAAEKKSGFKTGIRHVDADGRRQEVRVSVSFYPSTKFWICDVVDGRHENQRELTQEEYARTRGLLL